MTQQNTIPRLHMGCGEPLRSQWLLSVVRGERKSEAAPRKQKAERRERGQARG